MKLIEPQAFGKAVMNAARTMSKAATNEPVATSVGGMAIVFTGEAENQERPHAQPMVKASVSGYVSGYTRADGTRVKTYQRGAPAGQAQSTAGEAAAPKAKSYEEQARAHATFATRHEQNAARYKPGHKLHGLHSELAALHLGAGRLAEQATRAKTEREREAAKQAHAHLRARIVEGSRKVLDIHRAAKSPAQSSPAQPMTKAIPMLFERVQVKPRSEQKQAEIMTKSALGELWVHGRDLGGLAQWN